MPEAMAYMERQLPFLTNEEKRALIEQILRSMTFTIVCPKPPSDAEENRRKIHELRGVVSLPDDFDERAFKHSRLGGRLSV